MTFQEKFDELKAKYGEVDAQKLNESFAVQINMTEDESSGTFYVAYINGNFSIEPYDYHDHTAMITVPVEKLEAILSKKADAPALYFDGVLQVEGNLNHALALVDLLAKEEPAPKTSKPKKTTEKKAAEKKATEKKEKPTKRTKKANPNSNKN